MVALRPDEWKPICSSASSTVTRAWRDKAAAADRPAIPPPMTRMSAVFNRYFNGSGQLVHRGTQPGQSFDLESRRRKLVAIAARPIAGCVDASILRVHFPQKPP